MGSDSITAVSLINPFENVFSRPQLEGAYAKEGSPSQRTDAASATTYHNQNPSVLKKLTQSEKRNVQRLKQRDAEVRSRERAHIVSGGPYVRGGTNFQYQQGLDGRNYAVGGEVTIDVSTVPNNPDATVRKMKVVRRAALAPADPSPQGRSVAARATQIEAQAREEKRQLEQGELSQSGGSGSNLGKSGEAFTLKQNAVTSYSQKQPRQRKGSGAPDGIKCAIY